MFPGFLRRQRAGSGISLFLTAILILAATAMPSRAEQAIPAKVDPRVELMGIIFRLAGNPEFNQGRLHAYEKEVDRAFAELGGHPAVVLARRLREDNGIGYGAVMALALHVTNPPELAERVPFDPLPSGLDPRWTADTAREFLQAARLFARDSHFMAFFSDHQGIHDLTINRLNIALDKVSMAAWCRAYFGAAPREAFSVEVGLINGPTAYGLRVVLPSGETERHSVIGAGQIDSAGMPEFSPDIMQTIIHEYLYTHVATLDLAGRDRLAAAGQALYAEVGPVLAGLGYNDWLAMVDESLVRALTIRWLAAGVAREQVTAAVDYQQKMGFYWIDGLDALLAEFEGQRTKYPTLAGFMPRISDYFTEYAADAVARIDAVEAGWGH